jgi:hypothetical protein
MLKDNSAKNVKQVEIDMMLKNYDIWYQLLRVI